jgi:hypothetical protein
MIIGFVNGGGTRFRSVQLSLANAGDV